MQERGPIRIVPLPDGRGSVKLHIFQVIARTRVIANSVTACVRFDCRFTVRAESSLVMRVRHLPFHGREDLTQTSKGALKQTHGQIG